jgi:hypothetical protein
VNLQRAVAFLTILIVILLVAAALMVLGPPDRARSEALDRQRVGDLRHIEADVRDDYATAKYPLPDRLSTSKRDPVTRAPYEYRRLDAARYELCANYARPSPATADRALDDGAFWRHGAGRTCYRLDARRETML